MHQNYFHYIDNFIKMLYIENCSASQARDSSLPSSPVSPLQGSPPRHEIFRSSVPVPVCGSPSTNGLNGTSSNIPQLNSTQPNSHDWNSIDEQAWLEQGAFHILWTNNNHHIDSELDGDYISSFYIQQKTEHILITIFS